MAFERTPLTLLEQEIVRKLCQARFPPYSASKRFARDLGQGYVKQLSTNGRRFLAYVVHRFRRQYQLTREESQWVAEWLAREAEQEPPAVAMAAPDEALAAQEDLQLCLDL